ncbi:MAG: S41 family peptidase, partial [Gammaproteobacteria bacterium]|nr:S41 family peptidase [Gammaproteobacteria bacterium]
MQKTIKHSTLFLTGLLLGITLTIGHGVYALKTEPSELPLEALKTFTDVYHRITNDYVEKPDEKKLLEDAIRGMLSGLDPHSNFLNLEEFSELRIGTTGQFGGLGIEVGMEDGYVKVISPIDDTPAQRAGVLSGDLIVRLDDKQVKGMTLSDAVKVMRGKPDTDLVLTIIRDGEEKPLKITITREIIKVKSVKNRMIDEEFGYIRITSFQSRTTSDLLKAIDKLKEQNNGSLSGLILDLRNNPGGVLSAAVGVSDAFIKDGLIVYTEGRIKDSSIKFTATPTDALNGSP